MGTGISIFENRSNTYNIIVLTNFMVKSEEENQDTLKNWLLINNPHFLSYPNETLVK